MRHLMSTECVIIDIPNDYFGNSACSEKLATLSICLSWIWVFECMRFLYFLLATAVVGDIEE